MNNLRYSTGRQSCWVIFENNRKDVKMGLDELIALLPNPLNEIHLNCFYKSFNNQWIPDSPELFNLIEKGFLQISSKKDISRLEGYFSKNNIEKIKDKKEFIFKHLPSTKGLENGKRAAYEDLLDYIQKNHTYIFEEFLTDFNNYTFGEIVENNGFELLYYVAKKVDWTFADSLVVWHSIKNNGVSFKSKQDKTQKIMKYLKMFFLIPPFIENFIIKILKKVLK